MARESLYAPLVEVCDSERMKQPGRIGATGPLAPTLARCRSGIILTEPQQARKIVDYPRENRYNLSSYLVVSNDYV